MWHISPLPDTFARRGIHKPSPDHFTMSCITPLPALTSPYWAMGVRGVPSTRSFAGTDCTTLRTPPRWKQRKMDVFFQHLLRRNWRKHREIQDGATKRRKELMEETDNIRVRCSAFLMYRCFQAV